MEREREREWREGLALLLVDLALRLVDAEEALAWGRARVPQAKKGKA